MKTIIFDFDGTIADTLPVITKIYYEMFPNRAVMDKTALERLRLLPAQKIAKELGISGWKLPFMLRKGRKLMRQRMHEAELFTGMTEVIKELHVRGYQLEVVSSNSTENVELFLEQHQLRQYFKVVLGISGLFGKAKALRKLMSRQGLRPADVYYVGDEARDVLASQKVGIPVVAVSWGFNSAQLLRQLNPSSLIDDPKELLRIFGKNGVQL